MIKCKDLKEFLNENVPDDVGIDYIDLTWFLDLTKEDLIVVGYGDEVGITIKK